VTKHLQVAKDLRLPLGIVTHRNAILGMSGSGKSNTGVVLAEEMHDARVPWCLFDPKGDAFGLRSAADGKSPGLGVPIIGGDHADLPLSPRMGSRMAELVASGQLTGVFDLSDFAHERQALAAFMADFATTLLAKQKTPIHLFLDEADEYLPQPGAGGTLDGHVARCVGAWKRLATKGRQKGIGFTLISQRAANVNKTALYQCETLIAMRTAGKRDRVAIREFVESHGQADDLVQSLPSLADGEGWVWSPVRLKLMQRVKFRQRRTFDSGRTPEIGEALVVPELGELDLDALRAEFEALDAPGSEPGKHREHVVRDDSGLLAEVARLRSWVSELEGQLEDRPELTEDQLRRLEVTVADLHSTGIHVVEAARGVMAALPGHARGVVPNSAQHEDAAPEDEPKAAAPAARIVPSSPRPKRSDVSGGSGLAKCARAILTALHQHGDLSLVQAAIIGGYAPDSGGVRNAAGELRSGGFVEGSNAQLHITEGGRQQVSDAPRLPTGRKLAEYWYGKLDKAERLILSEVVMAYPKKVSLTEAAKRAGYAPDSGGVRNAAGRLRTLTLVHGGNGGMVADRRLV
jgi:hypothetical protein